LVASNSLRSYLKHGDESKYFQHGGSRPVNRTGKCEAFFGSGGSKAPPLSRDINIFESHLFNKSNMIFGIAIGSEHWHGTLSDQSAI
jgi:hypothetical protein